MVRNARLSGYERTPRPVVAIANDFPAGHVMPPHRHPRSQLVYGISGVMLVGSEQGRWVVPPERAALPMLPLCLRFPRHEGLAQLCRASSTSPGRTTPSTTGARPST